MNVNILYFNGNREYDHDGDGASKVHWATSTKIAKKKFVFYDSLPPPPPPLWFLLLSPT